MSAAIIILNPRVQYLKMQRRRHVTASGIFSNNKHPLICMSRNLVKGARRVVDLQGAESGTICTRAKYTRAYILGQMRGNVYRREIFKIKYAALVSGAEFSGSGGCAAVG